MASNAVAWAAAVLSASLVTCGPGAAERVGETPWGQATVIEELSIGVESGAAEYMLGRVRQVSVAPNGTIYVYDQQGPVVRMYDAAGQFVRNVGREGQGPGEYQFAALRVLSDNRLALWDYRNRRISFFSPAGEYERSVSVEGGTIAGLFSTDPAGNLVIETRTVVQSRPLDALQKYSTEGELLETLPLPSPDAVGRYFALSLEGEIRPFDVRTSWAWSPLGYLVVGRNDRYDIELLTSSATVHLMREVTPITVESAELAEWNEFRDLILRRDTERGRDGEQSPIPTQKPFFRDFHTGEDGRLWVFRYVAAVKQHDIEPIESQPDRPLLTWREPWTYDVFEPDGTFLGSVVVPELFRAQVFRGEEIWGVQSDNDGFDRVVRLQVIPEGSGGM